MTDPDIEDAAGRFSAADRAAVTAGCIPWLAGYFADAPTWTLTSQAAIGEAADVEVDEIARFIRMRVALASLDRLEALLGDVLVRPSFSYTRRVEESVGALRGPLDQQRYIRSRSRPESPRRYPVRVVRRRFDTDENVVAAYAALHVDRDLGAAPVHLLPGDAPERRAIERGRSAVAGWLRHPALNESAPRARDVHRRRHLGALIDRASARLESGHVAFPGRYEDLIDWMRTRTSHADAAPGGVEWAFYDERFDTKLFEIWSLAQLASALEQRLGTPTAATSLFERGEHPVRSWGFGGVRADLHFQPALGKLTDQPPAWRFTEPTEAALTGFPDLAVVVKPVVGERIVVLIDPKLRQRKAAPTEELYKLLGYFGNLHEQTPRGAIVFYTPGAPRVHRLEGASPAAQLLAVGIDPADQQAVAAGFGRIADLVLDAASIPAGVLTALQSIEDGDEEAAAAIRQKYVIDAMQAAAQALPAGTLTPIAKTTAATLGDDWERLPESARQMLVTAEFFGGQAPSDADHSGPLLGLAAACEATLFDYVLDLPSTARPDLKIGGATFGTMIYWLNDATYPKQRSDPGAYLRQHLAQHTAIDMNALRSLMPKLRDLNNTYRIPAAHREVVSQKLWSAGRSIVLDATAGVLAQLVAVCAPPAPADTAT